MENIDFSKPQNIMILGKAHSGKTLLCTEILKNIKDQRIIGYLIYFLKENKLNVQ